MAAGPGVVRWVEALKVGKSQNPTLFVDGMRFCVGRAKYKDGSQYYKCGSAGKRGEEGKVKWSCKVTVTMDKDKTKIKSRSEGAHTCGKAPLTEEGEEKFRDQVKVRKEALEYAREPTARVLGYLKNKCRKLAERRDDFGGLRRKVVYDRRRFHGTTKVVRDKSFEWDLEDRTRTMMSNDIQYCPIFRPHKGASQNCNWGWQSV